METFRRVRGSLALAACLVVWCPAAMAMETKPALSLDVAKK